MALGKIVPAMMAALVLASCAEDKPCKTWMTVRQILHVAPNGQPVVELSDGRIILSFPPAELGSRVCVEREQ